jgi:hypothetical protein
MKEQWGMKNDEKQAPGYDKPKVRDYGSLEELTAGTKSGNFLDATFPVHTPKSQLTFSG